jgi:hypothetical protein
MDSKSPIASFQDLALRLRQQIVGLDSTLRPLISILIWLG